jgi:hypothetical protein
MNLLVDYLKLIDLLALAALAALGMRRVGPQQKRLAVRGGHFGGNLGRDADHGLALRWLMV